MLTSLGDLSKWNTSKVTNMGFTFNGCKNLTELNLSGWNTAKVTDMRYMFQGCGKLINLDLSSFDTSSISNMRNMFGGFIIKNGDAEGQNISTIGKVSEKCQKLEHITLGAKFKFVGTECYLPTPSATYITGADGKWYDTTTGIGYTSEELATVIRTETVKYSATKVG